MVGWHWSLSPHAFSFKLKFTIPKTSNSSEFSLRCLPETPRNLLKNRPADLLDTLFMPLLGIKSHFQAVHVWSCTKSLWTEYLTNCLWEFHQIYNLSAVGDKDELIRLWGQRSRSRQNVIWTVKHFGRHFPTSLECMDLLYSPPGPKFSDIVLRFILGYVIRLS